MSYRWGQGGPAFEYPTCWRTENRFLTLRAAVLVVLALGIFWLALDEPDSLLLSRLGYDKPLGSPLPHVLMGCLYLALAAFDLWMARDQQRIRVVPGQPASLAADMGRQARGMGPGAAWLQAVIDSGRVPPSPLRGPYRALLARLAPQLPHAPSGLQDYVSERLAQLLFALGLGLVLLLSALLMRQPATVALAALLYTALAVGLVARSRWIDQGPPSPLAVSAALGLAVLIGLVLALLASAMPAAPHLEPLGLPLALAALLLSLVLIDGLGLLGVGRGAEAPATLTPPSPSPATADIACDPDRLLQEVERELHRYWSEGIPNRRHGWQPALSEAEGFSLTAVEESQPLLSTDQRDGIPPPTGRRHAALLLLGSLGLLMTVAGGALWVRLAHALLQDAAAPLATAATSLVLVVAGGYALRVGHFLWSRVEVESALLLLDSQRVAAPEGGWRHRLHWTVLRVRSVFYAGGGNEAGSRRLLSLRSDDAAAQRSVLQVQAYAQRSLADDRPTVAPTVRAAAATPLRAAAAPAASPRVAPAPPTAAATASAPRAPAAAPPSSQPLMAGPCSGCGKPVPAGARFCQHCGAALR